MDRPDEIANEITVEQWQEIVTGNLSFVEIEERFGQEVAIYAGIARDPDSSEWTGEDFARARPAYEVDSSFAEIDQVRQAGKRINGKEQVSILLDFDLLERFRSQGGDWQAKLNDELRKNVFGTGS